MNEVQQRFKNDQNIAKNNKVKGNKKSCIIM